MASAARLALDERCQACSAPGARDGFCAPCRADLPRLPDERCPVCALPARGHAICGECLRRMPAFDHTVAACEFAYPVDALVRSMKYARRTDLARALGSLLGTAVAMEAPPDIVIPVPLSRARLRERGFNQSLEIARHLPRHLAARIDDTVLDRARDTAPQAKLEWAARRANVRRAFLAHGRLSGQDVAVVDDVMTTGATADAAAAALKAAGAGTVRVWVVARALGKFRGR